MKKPFKQINRLFLMVLIITTFSCNKDNNHIVEETQNNEVSLQDLMANLDENPIEGQAIGIIQTDVNETSGFNITSQTPAGAFHIDSSTGEVSVADAALFDYETNPVLTATITANNATNSSVVNVNLNDLFEPAAPGNTVTEFVIGTDAYITPKAYLLVDDAIGDYERSFSFVFTDGDIIEDSTYEIAFDASTTVFTKINCNLMATRPTLQETPFFTWDPQSNPNGFLNIIMDGHNYSQIGISSYSNTNIAGNQTFGQPSNGTMYTHTGLPDGDSSNGNLFTINSRTFDLATMTGTIDCSYSYVDDNNVTVTGVYVGTYEILTAF